MIINAKTQLNLVIGNPVSHSLSPFIHQQIYDLLGINHVLLAIENPSLSELINVIKALSVSLTAVTLPFKSDILQYVDSQSEAVATLKAANTLLLKNGKIHAENTDIDGIRFALREIDLQDTTVLIIGAGGAAKAVAYALHSYRPHFLWMNRTQSNAEILQSQWGGQIVSIDKINPDNVDLIINATSVGMHPDTQASPLQGFTFKSHHTVFDLVYSPRETLLLRDARSAGAHCIEGIQMLIAQALKQIEFFTTMTLDTEALAHHLLTTMEGHA